MYKEIAKNTYSAPFSKLDVLPKNSKIISVNNFYICYLVSGTLILNTETKEYQGLKEFFVYIAKVKQLRRKDLYNLFKKQLHKESEWLVGIFKGSKETFNNLIKFEKSRRKGSS